MAMERWRPSTGSMEHWEPFRNLSDIQSEVNRLFDSSFGRPTATAAGTGERAWVPRLPKADEVKPREIKIDIV